MDTTKIVELFTGIAVIFDDEIENDESSISKIRDSFKAHNIPVAGYDAPPSKDVIPSLANASCVILDWSFKNANCPTLGNSGERLVIGETAAEDEDKKLSDFIKEFQEQIFVPLFIFTNKIEEAKDYLKNQGLLDGNGKSNRIFIENKSDLISDTNSVDKLFSMIQTWLEGTPSIYALKEWERVISKTKDKMFIDMQGYSPYWVKIIWESLERDSGKKDVSEQFGAFLTKSLVNRAQGYSFEETILKGITEHSVDRNDLKKIIEAERYMEYSDVKPDLVYTGDLFRDGKKYCLNITAQCDTMRTYDNSSEYDPVLYCITGEVFKEQKIAYDIELKEDGNLVFGDQSTFQLKDEDGKYCCRDLKKINEKFEAHKKLTSYYHGELLEKKTEVIISCVAGGLHLKFNTKIITKKFSEIKDKRIGRVLPPYITRIQQKCASNLIREGLMPLPPELFSREH